MGGTSRISREAYVRFCERLGVKFRGPTRQSKWEAPIRMRVPRRGTGAEQPVVGKKVRKSNWTEGVALSSS